MNNLISYNFRGSYSWRRDVFRLRAVHFCCEIRLERTRKTPGDKRVTVRCNSDERRVAETPATAKKRLHWFHTTFLMPGTLVKEQFYWSVYEVMTRGCNYAATLKNRLQNNSTMFCFQNSHHTIFLFYQEKHL